MSGTAEDELNKNGGGWERTISKINTGHLYVNVIGETSYSFFG